MPPEIPAPLPQAFNVATHFIDRPAREHPGRVAIVGEPAAVTYAELSLLVNRVGNALRGSKRQPGERVLIVVPDSAEFIASFFGAAKIGAVAVPVNPMTRSADYAYFLADSGARMAIVHSAALAEFLPAVHGTPLERVVLVGTSPSAPPEASAPVEFLNWIPWTQAGSIELPPYRTAASDTAFFLYTSGSGGQPKAAVHQHKDMLITSRGFAAGVLGLRPDDRTLSVSKLFFAYGLGNGMYFPFSVGASTVLNPDRPRADRIIDLVARHKPTVFFEVRIVDDTDQPVLAGEIGNLWVKGESAFAGYWNKPELTARTKRGEWVVTGDKFFRDADGYYHYCGRADDMMKVAGMWVSPGEVENVLLGHPAVAEAAVVGASDSAGLTRPVAYVVLRASGEGSAELAEEIRGVVRTRLVGYKGPQEVRVQAELPKTATGKIQRFRLPEAARG